MTTENSKQLAGTLGFVQLFYYLLADRFYVREENNAGWKEKGAWKDHRNWQIQKTFDSTALRENTVEQEYLDNM